MTGSEFVRAYRARPFYEWEKAALELARQGGDVAWPTAPVTLEGGGHTIVMRVPIDYFAIGTPEDYVRLPLTPKVAQAVADAKSAILPTPRVVYETWRQAPVKTAPIAMIPNRGAVLDQYSEHSALVDQAMKRSAELRSGMKKDVVVSSLVKPGKVIIFGWYRPDGPDVFDNREPMVLPSGAPNTSRQPIQPHSDAHGDFYVDYSHGVRLIEGTALVDGQPMALADVYTDPVLGKIVSHDGPLKTPRYPFAAGAGQGNQAISPPPPKTDRVTLVDLGLDRILELRSA